MKSARFRPVVGALAIALLAACEPQLLSIEVLPPRTAPSCVTPSAKGPSAARGLLDLNSTLDFHGAYFADLKLTALGGAMRINGLKLSFDIPGNAAGETLDAADDAGDEQLMGEIFVEAEADESASAILENVVLLPRDLATRLRDDANLTVSKIDFETIYIEIQALTDDSTIKDVKGSFALDVCEDCLVEEPDEETCANGFETTGACRAGQDAVLYMCSAPPSSLPFP